MPVEEGGAFGLKQGALSKLRAVFAAHPRVREVILYGSRAKGTALAGSDIDLALLGENLTVDDLLKIDLELDDLLLPYKVDMALYDRIDSPELLEHIQRVGKLLYQRPP